jgi:hypothetical protein
MTTNDTEGAPTVPAWKYREMVERLENGERAWRIYVQRMQDAKSDLLSRISALEATAEGLRGAWEHWDAGDYHAGVTLVERTETCNNHM